MTAAALRTGGFIERWFSRRRAEPRIEPDFDAAGTPDAQDPLLKPVPGIITVAGTQYAAGLFWGHVDPSVRDAQAVSAAKEFNEDLIALRVGNSAQYGTGNSKLKGHKSGLPAAAAILADSLPGSWLGLFEVQVPSLPNQRGFYYVAVAADAIKPDGDTVYESYEEALTQFRSDVASGLFDKQYASANLGISGTEPAEIVDLLAGSAVKPTRLRLADRSTVIRRYALLTTTTVLAGLAIVYGINYLLTEPEPMAVVTAPPPPPPPYAAQPTGRAYLHACAQLVDDRLLRSPGWRMIKFTCENDAASATFMRDFGTVGTLVNVWGNSAVRLQNQGQTAVISIGALRSDRAAHVTPTLTNRDIELAVWDRATLINEIIRLDPLTPGPGLPPGVSANRPRFYGGYILSTETTLSPEQWAEMFNVPGLVVEFSEWNGEKWNIRGKIYVRS